MVQSRAQTIADYLRELPPARRAVVKAVHQAVLKVLPRGYVATMNWGMISYEIPLNTYPVTYNGQPLSFGGLAAQKNFYALYLMCLYQHESLVQKLEMACTKLGKKLNMGKCCIRFKSIEDLPLDEICQLIKPMTPAKYIAAYESARGVAVKPSKKILATKAKSRANSEVSQKPKRNANSAKQETR